MDRRTVLYKKWKNLESLSYNSLRAMSIKLKIAKQKNAAISGLKNDLSNEAALNNLEICNKRERSFLKIIDNGLTQYKNELEENIEFVNNKAFPHLKQNYSALLELVKVYNSKIKEIEKRLELEEMFLESKEKKAFTKFVNQWKKEDKITKDILKKIKKVNQVEGYFTQLKQKIPTSIISGAIIGVARPTIDKLFMTEGSENIDPEHFIFMALAGMIAFSIATTVSLLYKMEKELEVNNMLELDDLKKNQKWRLKAV